MMRMFLFQGLAERTTANVVAQQRVRFRDEGPNLDGANHG